MRNVSKLPPKPLSRLEHQVMEVLWAQGSANSEQVRQALAPKKPLKDSTIRTILRRLQAKGYVKHEVHGRTYIYSVVESPGKLAVGAVRQIISRFCGGSFEQLLVGLVENEVVDRAELQQLARKIARAKPVPKGE